MRAFFDGVAADAWFGERQHERGGMPVEMLERDEVLAGIMPGHGDPNQPGGDDDAPEEEEDDEETEGDPS